MLVLNRRNDANICGLWKPTCLTGSDLKEQKKRPLRWDIAAGVGQAFFNIQVYSNDRRVKGPFPREFEIESLLSGCRNMGGAWSVTDTMQVKIRSIKAFDKVLRQFARVAEFLGRAKVSQIICETGISPLQPREVAHGETELFGKTSCFDNSASAHFVVIKGNLICRSEPTRKWRVDASSSLDAAFSAAAFRPPAQAVSNPASIGRAVHHVGNALPNHG